MVAILAADLTWQREACAPVSLIKRLDLLKTHLKAGVIAVMGVYGVAEPA